jgi:hypothetical protein
MAHFKLATLLSRLDLNATIAAGANVIVMESRIDDMKDFLSTIKAFFEEGHENLVLFVAGIEKRTDVARLLESVRRDAWGIQSRYPYWFSIGSR